MEVRIHPNAALAWNAEADKLLLQLSPVPEHLKDGPRPSFLPDLYIAAEIPRVSLSGSLRSEHRDAAGETLARWSECDGKTIGLHGDAYKALAKLAETMHRSRDLKTLVTHNSLKEALFEWAIARYTNQTTQSVCAYISDYYPSRIEECEIWLPISELIIQSAFQLGSVVFRPVTAELIDGWYKNWLSADIEPDELERRQVWMERRRQLQGHAAATLTLISEPQRAFEVAMEEANRSLAILRLFSPANLHPHLTSYCVPLGTENLSTHWCLFVKSGSIRREFDGISDGSYAPWTISDSKLEEYRDSGLELLNYMLISPKRTPFQNDLLDALLVYSRNTLARDPATKLMHIFTAIDSFLLRSDNEPIGDNISRRIAFTIETQMTARKDTVRKVKAAYNLRSKFIHHAEEIEDLDTLQQFLFIAWRFFMTLVLDNALYKTSEEFIQKLDDKMFS